MKNPQFVIQIATNSAQSKIICNDEDISAAVHSIVISQTAGEIPKVRLGLIPQAKIMVKCEPILELIRHQEDLDASNADLATQSSNLVTQSKPK